MTPHANHFCVEEAERTVLPARTSLPTVDTARCTGCGRCVAACHVHLLSLERQGWEKFSTLHESDRCTGCAACEVMCPFTAITMHFGVEHWTAPPLPRVAAREADGLGPAGT